MCIKEAETKAEKLAREEVMDEKAKEIFAAGMKYDGVRMVQWGLKKLGKSYLKQQGTVFNNALFGVSSSTVTGGDVILKESAAYLTTFIIPTDTNEIPNSKQLNRSISFFIDYDNPRDADDLTWGVDPTPIAQLVEVGPKNMINGVRIKAGEELNTSLNKNPIKLRAFRWCYATADKKSFTVSNEVHLMSEEEYKAKFQETEEGKKRYEAKQKYGKMYGGTVQLQLDSQSNEWVPLHPHFKVVVKTNGQFSQNSFTFGKFGKSKADGIKPSFANTKGILTLNKKMELVEAYLDESSNETSLQLSQSNSVLDTILREGQQQQQLSRVAKMSNKDLKLLNLKLRNEFNTDKYTLNERAMQQKQNELCKILGPLSSKYQQFLSLYKKIIAPLKEDIEKLRTSIKTKLTTNQQREDQYLDTISLQDRAIEFAKKKKKKKKKKKEGNGKGEIDDDNENSSEDNDNGNGNENDNGNGDKNDNGNRNEKGHQSSDTDVTVPINDVASVGFVSDENSSDDNLNLGSNKKRKMSEKMKQRELQKREQKKLRMIHQKQGRNKLEEQKIKMEKMDNLIVNGPTMTYSMMDGLMREKMYDNVGKSIKKKSSGAKDKEESEGVEKGFNRDMNTYVTKAGEHPPYPYSIDQESGVK